MKIATVSLNYYGQDSVDACRRAARTVAIRDVDFAGFTETRGHEMRTGLKQGLGVDLSLKGTGEAPQAFNNKRWRQVGSTRMILGNKGVDGITPNLYFTIGIYQNLKKPSQVVTIVTTHMVPLYGGQAQLDHFDERFKMWHEMWDKLKRIVASEKAKGNTVYVIGDFNNVKAPRNVIKQIDPRAKWIVLHGIDWIFCIEGRTKTFKIGWTRVFSSGSDHRAVMRNVILR